MTRTIVLVIVAAMFIASTTFADDMRRVVTGLDE
jgi:hypothetical protein